jgi:hypothetical protein
MQRERPCRWKGGFRDDSQGTMYDDIAIGTPFLPLLGAHCKTSVSDHIRVI